MFITLCGILFEVLLEIYKQLKTRKIKPESIKPCINTNGALQILDEDCTPGSKPILRVIPETRSVEPKPMLHEWLPPYVIIKQYGSYSIMKRRSGSYYVDRISQLHRYSNANEFVEAHQIFNDEQLIYHDYIETQGNRLQWHEWEGDNFGTGYLIPILGSDFKFIDNDGNEHVFIYSGTSTTVF